MILVVPASCYTLSDGFTTSTNPGSTPTSLQKLKLPGRFSNSHPTLPPPSPVTLSPPISVRMSLLPTATSRVPEMPALGGAGSAGFKPEGCCFIDV